MIKLGLDRVEKLLQSSQRGYLAPLAFKKGSIFAGLAWTDRRSSE